MPLILYSFFFFAILFFPGSAWSDDRSLEELISKIQAAYEGVNDLTASFEQETVIQDFKTSIKSKGELFLKKKDKMKLAYLQPKKEEILINGKQMTTYLPDQHQAIQGLFSKEQESKLPLRLLSGEAILKNDFEIQSGPDQKKEPFHLLLKPRQKGGDLEKIELEIDPSTYLIKSLRLYQPNQNYSSFRFSNIRINPGIKDSLFRFIPPEGTEVLNPFIPAK
jgi:outer membrane lipoprotein carrier protein